MKIEVLESVDSTNSYIKRYVCGGEDVCVRALRQTGGRGTKGRSFLSQAGGIYTSRLTFYNGLKASDGFKIMVASCMAVVKTLLCYGLMPSVKWPNDVFCGDKKICGILIENRFDGNNVDWSIVGTGINVNNPIADEIKEVATSMKEQSGKDFNTEEVFLTFLANSDGVADMDEYRKYSRVIGKKIFAETSGGFAELNVLDISDDGRLVTDKGIFSSAEIKKIM